MKAGAVGMLAVVVFAVASCGGNSVNQPAGSIKVTMTEYKFDPADITAPAGKVVFYLVNAGTLSHDMVIAKPDGSVVTRSELVSAGDQFVFNVDNIPAGSYKIYCDQPGHQDAGMKGTLTIS
jgi:uncharacterized cupredoxin-like copper-binding protein